MLGRPHGGGEVRGELAVDFFGLAVFCPITSRKKEYPFEVEIDTSGGIKGAVLADQLKSLDWRERQFECVGRATDEQLRTVVSRVVTLIGS